MDVFDIWTVPGSPFARAVMATLEEKGLPWRLRPLAPMDSKGPAHLARQPFGRMPAVEHGDFRLYETQAVMRYADRLVPTPALIPSEPRAEARMNQLMGISDWYLFPQVSAAIIFSRVIAPKFGIPVDEARIAAALPQAHVSVDEIARLLGDQTFMTGATLSLADLLLAPQLLFLPDCVEGQALLAPHANLRDWIARMEARPSLQATTWDAVTELARAA
ncbi:MAG TPA: glutathione S-transferase family protein [Caulobacteraceae bacterium]|jgi:glutathione S-transferase